MHSDYFSCVFLLAENRAKAGQLDAIRSLVDAITLHKGDARVVDNAAVALGNICCDNGV